MPIMYTPTVGKVCQRFSEVFNRPRGVYISSADRGNIYRILKNWPEKRVRLVVVTDGERVMGRAEHVFGRLSIHSHPHPFGHLSIHSHPRVFGHLSIHSHAHLVQRTSEGGVNVVV